MVDDQCSACKHDFEWNEATKELEDKNDKIAQFFGWAPLVNLVHPELSEEETPDFLNDLPLLLDSFTQKVDEPHISFKLREGTVYCSGVYNHGDEGCTCAKCRLKFDGFAKVSSGGFIKACANALSEGILDIIDKLQHS